MPGCKMLNVVVAVCNDMGIGIEGRIPWHLKKDMAFFKQITTETSREDKKNAVIMGKKTWQSIPSRFRPLSGRVNIVLSSQLSEAPEGALLARNFQEALNMASSDEEVENVFVIGGAAVYREAISHDQPCRVYLTRVLSDFKCDTFFPKLVEKLFKKVDSPENVPVGEFETEGVKFSFEVHEKVL